MRICHIAPQRSGHIWVASMIQSWIPGVEILDFEGHDPERLVNEHTSSLHKSTIVIQTRDLLNWYASYKRGKVGYRVGAIPTWEVITDEYHHPHHFLKYKIVRVLYDRFAVDQVYRKGICAQLGGVYSEEFLEFVPGSGHGSSFNGQLYQGRGSEMLTLTRYKQVPKELYEELFRNRPMLLEYYLEHAEDPEKVEFIKSLEL